MAAASTASAPMAAVAARVILLLFDSIVSLGFGQSPSSPGVLAVARPAVDSDPTDCTRRGQRRDGASA